MKSKVLGAAAALGLALATHGPASAAGGIKVGTLNCNVAGGWGHVIQSSRRVNCVFSPSHLAPERYVGQITKVGLDLGYRNSGTMVWAVFAPTERLGRGDLHGNYAGVTASATVGVGLGANALVGGSGRTFTLQPLSIEGSTGLNVAAGVGSLNLEFVPARPWRRHHAY